MFSIIKNKPNRWNCYFVNRRIWFGNIHFQASYIANFNTTINIFVVGNNFGLPAFCQSHLSTTTGRLGCAFYLVFHAKMIYTAGAFGQSTGWQNPVVAFSHPDYPNLVPTLAAQAAFVVGFWNEYIPKISLFFMLGPSIIW